MLTSRVVPIILLNLALPLAGAAQRSATSPSDEISSENTLWVGCGEEGTSRQVLSPLSLSEGGNWRAYVEVDAQGKGWCLNTTRLWVAGAESPYRLVYMMPPKRTDEGNGIEILGWARNSRMLLVLTEEWQWGSDAGDTQQVLAIDAGTGMVYEPELGAMLQAHENKQCSFRVTDAGFTSDGNVNILVRTKFSTWYEEDETLQDVPPAKRCGNFEETWSFNFATGEIKAVANTEPLHIFKKFLPNPQAK
jgi:hypothetical protein